MDSAAAEISAMSQLAKEGALKGELDAAMQAAASAAAAKEKYSAEELSALRSELQKLVPETPAATSAIVPRFQRLTAATLRSILSAILSWTTKECVFASESQSDPFNRRGAFKGNGSRS
jgi:hypothetical protein